MSEPLLQAARCTFNVNRFRNGRIEPGKWEEVKLSLLNKAAPRLFSLSEKSNCGEKKSHAAAQIPHGLLTFFFFFLNVVKVGQNCYNVVKPFNLYNLFMECFPLLFFLQRLFQELNINNFHTWEFTYIFILFIIKIYLITGKTFNENCEFIWDFFFFWNY